MLPSILLILSFVKEKNSLDIDIILLTRLQSACFQSPPTRRRCCGVHLFSTRPASLMDSAVIASLFLIIFTGSDVTEAGF